MKIQRALTYAMEIGECMLVSGAGVSRVEDTITRICQAYGAEKTEVFSITSSIVTSITDSSGEVHTQTKRIRSYRTDFRKLDELNQLSRYMCRCLPGESEVKSRILQIKEGKRLTPAMENLTSAVIAGAFTLFFGGGWIEGILGFCIGGLITMLSKYFRALASNSMVFHFLLSFVVASLAYLAAKAGFTSDYGKIIIGNLMLLVPGVAFVNSLRDMIGGDMMSGILRLCESVILAVFLAGGSFLALFFWGGVWQ